MTKILILQVVYCLGHGIIKLRDEKKIKNYKYCKDRAYPKNLIRNKLYYKIIKS